MTFPLQNPRVLKYGVTVAILVASPAAADAWVRMLIENTRAEVGWKAVEGHIEVKHYGVDEERDRVKAVIKVTTSLLDGELVPGVNKDKRLEKVRSILRACEYRLAHHKEVQFENNKGLNGVPVEALVAIGYRAVGAVYDALWTTYEGHVDLAERIVEEADDATKPFAGS